MSPTTIPGNLILKNEMVEADPFFNNVSLLLHGDGTNGSTTIVDSSPSPKTGTAVGDAQISTAQSKFGGSSIVFDKVDDRITYASSNDFAFGTGDFTIEFWAYSRDVSGSTQRGFCQISSVTGGLAPTGDGVAIHHGIGTGGIRAAIGPSDRLFSSTGLLTTNTWFHIALTRSGTTAFLFVDGVIVDSITNTTNLSQNNFVLGGYFSTSFLYDGYIDDLRITKGVARYTANFTPPTAPFPEVLG